MNKMIRLIMPVLAVFGFSVAVTTTAHAKILGTTKYAGKTVEVSTGHNNPNNCYYRVGGGEWQSAPWSLCAKLGAKKS